jgi:hypothetical protein
MPERNLFQSLPKKEPGVISMLYWGTYHGDIQSAFHMDDTQGMDFFQITDEGARELIKGIGKVHGDPLHTNPQDPQVRGLCKEFFDRHLVDEFLEIWTTEIAGTEPLSTPVPRGLMPFMYWVRHQYTMNQAFRQNPEVVMKRFGLASGARSLIMEIGAHHDKPEGRERAKALFEQHLVDEFLRVEQPAFW